MGSLFCGGPSELPSWWAVCGQSVLSRWVHLSFGRSHICRMWETEVTRLHSHFCVVDSDTSVIQICLLIRSVLRFFSDVPRISVCISRRQPSLFHRASVQGCRGSRAACILVSCFFLSLTCWVDSRLRSSRLCSSA